MACWLIEQWEKSNDPRAQREDRYLLAGQIAEAKGKRISGLPESVSAKRPENPLANVPTEELKAELRRRMVLMSVR